MYSCQYLTQSNNYLIIRKTHSLTHLLTRSITNTSNNNNNINNKMQTGYK